MPRPIIIVQGGQWGSEGKGMVAEALGHERGVDIAVRTGAVNAGHTIYYKGKKVVMQQLPCGWTKPGVKLVIGPGAYINPVILDNECRMIEQLTGEDIRNRLVIDYRAGIHLDAHTAASKEANRHHKIGATGKGCSEAIVDKIRNRGNGYMNFSQCSDGYTFDDTVELIHSFYDGEGQILIEGTQGAHLDLLTGPYPYTTHKPCNASQWVVECGLSPAMEYEVVLVFRTFPIRVAGNSGPMPREMGWTEFALEINRKLEDKGLQPILSTVVIHKWQSAILHAGVRMNIPTKKGHFGEFRNYDTHTWDADERLLYKEALSELHARAIELMDPEDIVELRKLFELTTVTKKLRRIARFDDAIARYSIMMNRPKTIVLTFLNHMFPELWGSELPNGLPAEAREWIGSLEKKIGHPIQYVTTGPERHKFLKINGELPLFGE